MNKQISTQGRLILATGLVISMLVWVLIWQAWRPQRVEESEFFPDSGLQSLTAPSTNTLLSLARANSLVQGQPAPDFSLPTLDSQRTVTLSELRGKPVILNFWASWCTPCRTEMPALQQAHKKRQADELTILAINLSAQDTLAEAKAFVEELQLTMPILLDEAGAAEEGYHILGLPTTFFIDNQGLIARIHFGPMDEIQIEAYIAEISPGQPD